MATHSQLLQYLEALRDRGISFRDFNRMLKAADLPTARGWDVLIPKYRAIGDVETRARCLELLEEIYKNHIMYSERAVVVFRFESGQVAALADAADSWVDTNSPFLPTYPLPLSQSRLGRLRADSVVTTVEDHEATGGKQVISCSKRYVRSRVPIDLTDFPQDAKQALAGYEEVIGIRSRYVQAFDVLMLDVNEDMVVLSIDLCGNLSMDDIGRCVVAHLEWLGSQFQHLLDAGTGPERVNFFPRIVGLYAEKDGSVERVGHVTSSGSSKSERMRSKGKDLRTEPFHKKGLEAIAGGTDLFAIHKRWAVDDYHVGVTIPGHFSQVNEEEPVVGIALIDGCRNETDFLTVLNKLVQ